MEERDPLRAATQYDVGNDGEEEEDVVWTDDAVWDYDQEEAEPDGQEDERGNRGTRKERLLSAVDQELLACAAQGVLHRAFTRASTTPGPAVAGSSPLTTSQLEWLQKKRQSIFAAPPEGDVLPALEGRRPHTVEVDDTMDQDAEEGGELESTEAGGKEEGIEGSRRRAAGPDDGSTAELSAVGHLVAAYRLLLLWERGEGPMKVDSEKNNNDSQKDKRTVSQHFRHLLTVVAGAGKRKIWNAYTYMTTATAGQQKDPFIKPRVQFEEEWRHVGTVIAGKLHLIWVNTKGKHGAPSAWRSAYGRILESNGRLVLFPSKQSFQEKRRACLVLALGRARFSFFSAPSDDLAGSHAAACGNVLRVQDFDACGEGSSVVLYLKFRKASSRDLWYTALKRARAKAVKCNQIVSVVEENQGRGEEVMGGLSAADRQADRASETHALGALSENVLRCGWLQKQNPHEGIYKQWKKRYFKLTDTALLYGKSEKDATICEVPLNRIKGVEKSDGQGRDWCLEVATNLLLGGGKRRVYVLQASSKDEAEGWLADLKSSTEAFKTSKASETENKQAKTNLQALLARAGDVNVKGSNGLTCLHLAALNGSLPSLLELLKVKGLLLEVRSDAGQTPLNIAVLHGNKDAVLALLKAGAHDVRFLC